MTQSLAIKPSASVNDESLETNPEGNLHLSIQSGEGSLSWALLLSRQNKYLALESYKGSEAELLQNLKSKSWFGNVISVSIAVAADKVTLVPEPLFDEKVKETYSSFNFETTANHVTLSSKVRSAGCIAVFTLDREKEQLYRNFFPGIKILPAAATLLEPVLTNDKNESSEKVYLNMRSKSMELVVTSNGSLQYYNTFSYISNEDVIYYLLFAFEQLKLNPETVSLQLMGDVEKNDGVYSIIHKYVRNVNFISRNARFDYSYRFSEIQPHAFYTLFSQYLCG